MPGLLSNIFADGGSYESAQGADAQADLDLAIDLEVQIEAEATWESIDGTTHNWSSDTTLALDVDAGAALGAAGTLGSSAEEA